MRPIRPDAADHCGEVDHDLWLFLAVEAFDCVLMDQVVVRLARYDDVGAPTRLEESHDVTTKKSGAACNEDSLSIQFHQRLSMTGMASHRLSQP